MNILKDLGDLTLIAEIVATAVVAVYSIYAFLILRQTKMLNEGFRTDSEKLLKSGALIHFLATIALIFIGVIIILT